MPTLNSAFVDQIDAAIQRSPHLARRDLRCVVDEGNVVLRGVVNSYYQKQMAQEVVRRVDGVQSIKNELEVTWAPPDWCQAPEEGLTAAYRTGFTTLHHARPTTPIPDLAP